MDQQSTKSEAPLMKRKNSTIQSRAIERDILKLQSAPDVDINVSDGNPLNFK